MDFISIIWDADDEDGGNVQHVAEHGLSPDDVDAVLESPYREGFSRSTGQPAAFGYTPDGRYIIVIYEQVDEDRIYPVTAYEIDEP